jgi:hypothetical protein
MTEKPSDHEGRLDSDSWGEIEYHLGKLSVIGAIDSDKSEAVIKSRDTVQALGLLFRGTVERVPTKDERADFKAVIDFLIKARFLSAKDSPKDYE